MYIAGAFLQTLLTNQTSLIGAEIGCNNGATTEHLLKSLDIKKLYCIDPWLPYGQDNVDAGSTHKNEETANQHYQEFLDRTGFAEEKLVILRTTSKEATKNIEDASLNFVFIDADHSYESVKEDLNLWWPKVKYQGLFSGHDCDWLSVQKALNEFSEQHHGLKISEGPNHIWWTLRVL